MDNIFLITLNTDTQYLRACAMEKRLLTDSEFESMCELYREITVCIDEFDFI